MIYGLDTNGVCTDYTSLEAAVYALQNTPGQDAYVFCPGHGQNPFYPERVVCTADDVRNGTLQTRMQEEERWVKREQEQEQREQSGEQTLSAKTQDALSAQDAPEQVDPATRPVISLNTLMEAWFPNTVRAERDAIATQENQKESREEILELRHALDRGKLRRVMNPQTGKEEIGRVSLKDAILRAKVMSDVGASVRDMGIAALNGPVELHRRDGSILSMRPEKDQNGEINVYAYIRDASHPEYERVADFLEAQEAVLDYRLENHYMSEAGQFMSTYQKENPQMAPAMKQTINRLKSLTPDQVREVQNALVDRAKALEHLTKAPESVKGTEILAPVTAEQGTRIFR